MKYTMQILDNNEFDRLPYKDTQTSLGIADPKTKTAFVRKTGIKPMDVYTAMHELEHLEEGKEGKFAHHLRNGVYYKGFGDVLGNVSNVAAMIPGPWQVPAMAYSGANAMGLGIGDKQAAKSPDTTNYNAGQSYQPTIPQAASPNVSQGQSVAGGSQTGGAGSAGVMENLRRMLGSESGRSPSDMMSQQFGTSQGTGRMA